VHANEDFIFEVIPEQDNTLFNGIGCEDDMSRAHCNNAGN
jgi:hypothetical protein